MVALLSTLCQVQGSLLSIDTKVFNEVLFQIHIFKMKYKVEKPFTDLFCNVRLRYYLIVKNTDLFCKIREHLVILEEACKQCKNIS